MNLNEVRNKLLKNKNFRDEYFNKVDLKKEIALAVFEARLKAEVTQEELARRIGTHQPSIARIENGTCLPSIRFLEKIAVALGTLLLPPRFGFIEPKTISFNNRVGGFDYKFEEETIGEINDRFYEAKVGAGNFVTLGKNTND